MKKLKNKLLCMFTALALTITGNSAVTYVHADTPPDDPITYIYGDVNGNGQLEASDALAILKHVVQLTPISDDLTLTLADVNHDGTITATDALEVLKCVVKLQDPTYYTVTPSTSETPVPTDEPTNAPDTTAEPIITPDPDETDTPDGTETPNPSESAVPTETPDGTPTATPVPVATETAKPTEVPTEKPDVTEKPVETAKPTAKPVETATPKPTKSPIPTETVTPTIAPTPVPTVKPTAKPTPKPTETVAPTESPAVTEEPVVTEAPTATPKPTADPTIAPTETPVPTETPEPTVEPTVAPTEPPVAPKPTEEVDPVTGCHHHWVITYKTTITVIDREEQHDVKVPNIVWKCVCGEEFHGTEGNAEDELYSHQMPASLEIAYHSNQSRLHSADHIAAGYQATYDSETKMWTCNCGWSHYTNCNSSEYYIEYFYKDIPEVKHEETTISYACSRCGKRAPYEYPCEPANCTHEWYVVREPWFENVKEFHFACICGQDFGLYEELTEEERATLEKEHLAPYDEYEIIDHKVRPVNVYKTINHDETYRCKHCGSYQEPEVTE